MKKGVGIILILAIIFFIGVVFSRDVKGSVSEQAKKLIDEEKPKEIAGIPIEHIPNFNLIDIDFETGIGKFSFDGKNFYFDRRFNLTESLGSDGYSVKFINNPTIGNEASLQLFKDDKYIKTLLALDFSAKQKKTFFQKIAGLPIFHLRHRNDV